MGANNPQVVIIGGGVIGSAIASFLMRDPAFGGTVTVIERDPTYARASSALSASSIRQQFSTPVNIAIGQFGIEFMRDLGHRLAVAGEPPPDIGLVEPGYLFLATARGASILESNHAIQHAMGAAVELLDPAALRTRFPWLSTDGIVLGAHGVAGEGWFDAAGPWGATIAGWAGIDLPVRARRRTVFVFDSPQATPRCPLVIDPSGVYFRPEGTGYICGVSPDESNDPVEPPLEPEHAVFSDVIWPVLAARVPGFEALRQTSAWAGYYEMNTFDANGIVGPHTKIKNLFFANGFSGHGMQQSPAVGRAIAELIVHGASRTLDLGPLAFDRIVAGRPLRELNVV